MAALRNRQTIAIPADQWEALMDLAARTYKTTASALIAQMVEQLLDKHDLLDHVPAIPELEIEMKS